jgi:hypothetical protein
MTKKAKKILFRLSLTLFLLLSPVAILYAQGYKYDFEDGKFYLTGTLALKANVSAEVYLNGELEGKTSFFGDAFNQAGLLPDAYQLSVKRDGYSSFDKNAQVSEGKVTDFPKVILIPLVGEEYEELVLEIEGIFNRIASESATPTPSPTATPSRRPTPRVSPSVSPSPTPWPYTDQYIIENGNLYSNSDETLTELASNVKGFRLSQDENKLAYWTTNELWVLWLRNQNHQPHHEANHREMITKFSVPVESAAWFRGEDHIIVRFGAAKPYSYKITEIDTRGGLNVVEI